MKNILVAFDDNYIEQAIVMLRSVFFNNKGKFKIYLLYSNLSSQNLKKISDFIKKSQHKFCPISVDQSIFEKAPKRNHTSIETYFRILAFEILDKDVDRIVYLDPDMIITDSLDYLYKIDMENYSIAGVPDYGINNIYIGDKICLGLSKKDKYINAGLLVMNIKRIRENCSTNEIFKYFDKNNERFHLQDQDFINAYFKDEILYLPEKFNYDVWYKTFWELLFEPIKRKIGILQKPAVIHYMGGEYKPWSNEGYGGKWLNEYIKYCKGDDTTNLYNKVKNNYYKWYKNYGKIFMKYISGKELCK